MTPRMRMRGYGGAAVVVLTATVAYLMIQQPIQEDETARANTTASKALKSVTEIQKQVDANASALADANRRLVALGKAPVPVPPVPTPDEFTAAEAAAVRVIVADQIARTPAQITQAEISQIARVAAAFVPKAKDGKTPTAAELNPIVKVVLAQYCTGDKCVGRTGSDGKQGDKGDPAPKVTDEELLAASAQSLAAYCGQENKPCQGTAGVAGKDAPPPYSVVDQDCVGDGDQSVWRIYLSNGTDQKILTARGPCRVGPDPD